MDHCQADELAATLSTLDQAAPTELDVRIRRDEAKPPLRNRPGAR
jgi:hypothetical protein